jgi:transcriptional regulator with XRE-family HTH domain
MQSSSDENFLGTYLRDRRARLDPASFGLPVTRRRTPGLRREEVAQRANVSATWYTWLEQGRGGAPSADVLERLARALTLTPAEREHLFLLGLKRPREVQYQAAERVSPQLQRVLDALECSPALVKNVVWDVVAWNRAAAAVLTDYGALAPENRNMLRRLFCDPSLRETLPEWEANARLLVAVFRADAARAGASKRAEKLVAELSAASPEFVAMWRDHDVQQQGEGTKHLHVPGLGQIALDYSSFAVDGQPSLSMMIFTPAESGDADRVRTLIRQHTDKSGV